MIKDPKKQSKIKNMFDFGLLFFYIDRNSSDCAYIKLTRISICWWVCLGNNFEESTEHEHLSDSTSKSGKDGCHEVHIFQLFLCINKTMINSNFIIQLVEY